MTTDRYLWLAAHAPGSVIRASLCGCGQELDHCVRQHCPRCGVALDDVVVDPAAWAGVA